MAKKKRRPPASKKGPAKKGPAKKGPAKKAAPTKAQPKKAAPTKAPAKTPAKKAAAATHPTPAEVAAPPAVKAPAAASARPGTATTPAVPAAAPVERSAPPGLRDLLKLRARRVDLLVAALLLVLGFALAVQVRSTQDDSVLTNARQEDLVQILDELSNRSDRLRDEVASLQATQQRLTSGSGASSAALAEARRRTQLLGVLAGTAPATGPGVYVRITDPKGEVSASVLLNALEELRNAGAEAIQLEGTGTSGAVVAVRVVAQTYLTDTAEGVVVDKVPLRAPYRFVAIGDASTMASAMAIPGGVEDAVRQQGGDTTVTRATRVQVTALRPLETPRYARADG